MNTEALARQHGKPVQEQNAEVEYLFTLDGIESLLAAEREACAKVCEEMWGRGYRDDGSDQWMGHDNAVQSCAAAIRARSNP